MVSEIQPRQTFSHRQPDTYLDATGENKCGVKRKFPDTEKYKHRSTSVNLLLNIKQCRTDIAK